MALPKITHPIYSLTLPSTGKSIKYRGFLDKEEKILLLAVQSQSPEQHTIALKQILTNCIIDNIDVSKMIMPDFEYVYLQIVTKSIGEELDLVIGCASCHEEINYKVLLNEIPAPEIKKRANVVEISEGMYIVLKYPTIDNLDDLDIINETKEVQEFETIVKTLADHIDCIVHGDETFSLKDQTEEEILEWFAQLSSKQMGKITEFFRTIPTIEETIEFTCKVCEHHNKYSIRGISELFS